MKGLVLLVSFLGMFSAQAVEAKFRCMFSNDMTGEELVSKEIKISVDQISRAQTGEILLSIRLFDGSEAWLKASSRIDYLGLLRTYSTLTVVELEVPEKGIIVSGDVVNDYHKNGVIDDVKLNLSLDDAHYRFGCTLEDARG